MVVSERRLSIPNNPITGVLLAIPGYFLGVWLGGLFGLLVEPQAGRDLLVGGDTGHRLELPFACPFIGRMMGRRSDRR